MINEIEPTAAGGSQIRRVNLSELHASPTNPRKHFDEKGLKELAASIEEHGVKMPLLVRPSKTEPGKYEIIAGERRYRASTLLVGSLVDRINVETSSPASDERDANANRLEALHSQRIDVPVIVEDLDDATVLELQLIENLQRRDLTALEEAQGYQALLELNAEKYTPQMIARKIGKSVDTVLNKLKMLKAPKELLLALEEGKVSERHLVLVASVPSAKGRKECAERVLQGTFEWAIQGNRVLTVRETNQLVNENFRQSLKKAAWDLNDAELLPEAGACATCPHFARHAATQDAELAAELGNGRGQTDPLTCMLPDCFKKKAERVWKQKQAEAKSGEVTVLKAEEAKGIVDADGDLTYGLGKRGWVKLEDKLEHEFTGHFDANKAPMWRTVVEDRLPKGAIHVVNTEKGGIVELVKKSDAVEAGKAHKKYGKLFEKVVATGKTVQTAAEKKKKEKESFEKKVGLRVKSCMLQHLLDCALSQGMDAEAGLAVLESALYEAGQDGNKLIFEWLKLELPVLKKSERPCQEHYRAAIIKSLRDRLAGKPEIDAMIMIANVSKWVKAYGVNVASTGPLMKHFGFDKKTITTIAEEQVQAELDAKAAKKKPKQEAKAAAKNSTDPTDVSTEKEVSKTKAADKIAAEGSITHDYAGWASLDVLKEDLLHAEALPFSVTSDGSIFYQVAASFMCTIGSQVMFAIHLVRVDDGEIAWGVEYRLGTAEGGCMACSTRRARTRARAVFSAVGQLRENFTRINVKKAWKLDWQAGLRMLDAIKDAAAEAIPAVGEVAMQAGETEYFHCDECGAVCAVGCDHVADVEALKVGEFKCSECAEGVQIFGTEFPPVANQDEFWPWVPGQVEEKANDDNNITAEQYEFFHSTDGCSVHDLQMKFGLRPLAASNLYHALVAGRGKQEAADDAHYNDAEQPLTAPDHAW